MPPVRFIAHSKKVWSLAFEYGWVPAARYTNLRDVRHAPYVGFVDIDWKQYNFPKHLSAVQKARPCVTVARDVEDRRELQSVLIQAAELGKHACHVVIVPKDPKLESKLEKSVPPEFILGFSVPTTYGGTNISPAAFKRSVHILGGRPEVQRKLADLLRVVSIDSNRFTLDARYGDYFDGKIFRPHPVGGYARCLEDSIRNINRLWSSYESHPFPRQCLNCPVRSHNGIR